MSVCHKLDQHLLNFNAVFSAHAAHTFWKNNLFLLTGFVVPGPRSCLS